MKSYIQCLCTFSYKDLHRRECSLIDIYLYGYRMLKDVYKIREGIS